MKRLASVAAALLGLGLLAGCSDSSTANESTQAGSEAPFEVSGDAVETADVELPKSYKFEPSVIEVPAGTTVTWTNRDDFPHNIRLRSGPDADETSKNVGIGDKVTIDFDQAGTYYYDCSFHPAQMQGKVIVTG